MKDRPIVLVCGGSSGHVNPAIAVLHAMKELRPTQSFVFYTAKGGGEQALLEATGVPIKEIHAGMFPTKRLASWWPFLWKNTSGMLSSLWAFLKKRPALVFATGGYVSSPVVLAARILRIPLAIHEQNAFPGRSNRFLAQGADQIFLSFPKTEGFFKHQDRCKLVGNPVREVFFTRSKEEARKRLGLDPKLPLIVILGGSQGAHQLNESVLALIQSHAFEDLKARHPGLHLVLSCGRVQRELAFPKDAPEIEVHRQIDTTLYMPAADLLIGRSGASFLMECAACGKPSILVPSPNVSENHQLKNAALFLEAGASLLLEDAGLSGERLAFAIDTLLGDPQKRLEMGKRAKDLAKPGAAQSIAQALLGSK